MKNLELLTFSVFISINEVLSFTDEEMKQIKTMHDKCVGETGVSEDTILRARKGDFDDDEKLQCYMKCIWVSIGAMSPEGVPDISVLEVALPDHIHGSAHEAMVKCATEVGSNMCETAFKISVCVQKHNPEYFFLP